MTVPAVVFVCSLCDRESATEGCDFCGAVCHPTLTEGELSVRDRRVVAPPHLSSPSVSVPFVEVHEQDGFRAIVFGEAWPGGLRVDRVDVETR